MREFFTSAATVSVTMGLICIEGDVDVASPVVTRYYSRDTKLCEFHLLCETF